MNELSDEQWWVVSDYCSMPVALQSADITKPFIYVRGYGVFYVNMGHHHIMFATIYAWQKGILHAGDGLIELDMSIDEMADALSEQDGVAWRSSVGRDIIYASSLNYAERSYLQTVEYI